MLQFNDHHIRKYQRNENYTRIFPRSETSMMATVPAAIRSRLKELVTAELLKEVGAEEGSFMLYQMKKGLTMLPEPEIQARYLCSLSTDASTLFLAMTEASAIANFTTPHYVEWYYTKLPTITREPFYKTLHDKGIATPIPLIAMELLQPPVYTEELTPFFFNWLRVQWNKNRFNFYNRALLELQVNRYIDAARSQRDAAASA